MAGNLTFDCERHKVSFYYGFYDPQVVAQVLSTSTTISLDVAATAIAQLREATKRFEETSPDVPATPEHMLVSFIAGSEG